MKAWVVVRNKGPFDSFELQEKPDPVAEAGEVVVDVDAFGLNYADVMARMGLYRDAPPLPSVVGYEAVGRISSLGEGVDDMEVGDRVIAFTRFGAYATKVKTSRMGVVKIPEEMENGVALALGVQYSTAWFCSEYQIQMHPGQHVLVQAAAGGVGTALVQMAKRRGCIVYGTAGSDAKLEYLRKIGCDHPINYRKEDFFEVISKMRGDKGLDIVFDSLGGKPFKQGYKLLGNGGRIIGLGTASRVGKIGGIIGVLQLLFGFGFYNPAFLLLKSKCMLGVNMLRIADERPEALRECMERVVDLVGKGELSPVVGKVFTNGEVGKAHEYVENRKSIGKVIVEW